MIQDIIEKIESTEFSSLLGIASDFRLFQEILYKQEAFKLLVKAGKDNQHEICWYILERIAYLSQKEIDHRYENPGDTAITVYLIALSLINLETAQTASNFVLKAENCWWANKVAKYLLQSKLSQDKVKVKVENQAIKDFEPSIYNRLINPEVHYFTCNATISSGKRKVVAFSDGQTIATSMYAYRKIQKSDNTKVNTCNMWPAQSIST